MFYLKIIVNLITLSRIILLIPLIFIGNKNQIMYIAIWSFFSDFLDGFLARKWNVTTNFGAKLDQYIDKIVSLLFLFYFIHLKEVSFIFVNLVLLRELLVVIFRYYKWSYTQSNIISKIKQFLLYFLFILLSSKHLFASLKFDFKLVVMVLVILSSWFSLLFTIKKIKSPLVYFIGTSGLTSIVFKKAPGTISSFAACLLFFILFKSFTLEFKVALLIMLLILHFFIFNEFLKLTNIINDDPNIYTIDETIAVVIAWVYFGELNIISLIIMFSLFRFFDITKFFAIRSIEKETRFSPMFRNLADDILAMFYVILIFILHQVYVAKI